MCQPPAGPHHLEIPAECDRILNSMDRLREHVRTVQEGFVVGRFDAGEVRRLRDIRHYVESACVRVLSYSGEDIAHLDSDDRLPFERMPPLEQPCGAESLASSSLPLEAENMDNSSVMQPAGSTSRRRQSASRGKTFRKQFLAGKPLM
jgi:hypothetical protein